VSIENNTLRIHRVGCAIDCDRIVNPDTIAAQMEAASTMACRPRYMARSRSRWRGPHVELPRLPGRAHAEDTGVRDDHRAEQGAAGWGRRAIDTNVMFAARTK